jgi:hypothetical protein
MLLDVTKLCVFAQSWIKKTSRVANVQFLTSNVSLNSANISCGLPLRIFLDFFRLASALRTINCSGQTVIGLQKPLNDVYI